VRAVLDPNVIISALLSPFGTPARILRAWREGAFELVASALLIAALERALTDRDWQVRQAAEDVSR